MVVRTRTVAVAAVLAMAAVVAVVQIQSSFRPRAMILSEDSALALAEGKISQEERQQIAVGVKLQEKSPENKAVALAEGKITDEERQRIANGVSLKHTAPENKAVALAEGEISDEEKRSIAQGGIGGNDLSSPENKAVALAEGKISSAEARSIADGGSGETDLSPPDSPALALAEDRITDEERESIARGGYGSGPKKARAPPTAEKQRKLRNLVEHVKKQKAPATFEEQVQKFAIAPQPEELGTVVDEKKTLAQLAAEQETIKQRRAAMAAERTVLSALAKKREEREAAEKEKQAQERKEVRKELGLTGRVEGHGGLDAMADKAVPLATAYAFSSSSSSSSSSYHRAARASAQRAQRRMVEAHPHWAVYVDKHSGRPYYFDARSGKSTWQFPNTQQLRAREYTPEEEKEKAHLREDRLDADRKESSIGGFPAFGSRAYVDAKTGVLVSHWPLDLSRILPAPNLDSSARIQNQRMAQEEEWGPNSWTAGSPGKLNALGVNVDGGAIANLPRITKKMEETHKLEDMGVLVDHPPFTGYKAVPYPGFDRTQWDYAKQEPYKDFHNRYEVDDDDWRMKKAGVRVYTRLPQMQAWEPEHPQKQLYVDGMMDNMHPLEAGKPYKDYIPDSLDATPLHLWLKGKIDEGKNKIFHSCLFCSPDDDGSPRAYEESKAAAAGAPPPPPASAKDAATPKQEPASAAPPKK